MFDRAPFLYPDLSSRWRRAQCATPPTWREANDLRLVDISIGSLDNPEAITPTMHVWTDSRIAWCESAEHLPRYRANERPKAVP